MVWRPAGQAASSLSNIPPGGSNPSSGNAGITASGSAIARPAMVDANGVSLPLQANIGAVNPEIWSISNAGATTIGSLSLAAGAPSFPVPAVTSIVAAARRIRLTGSGAAGQGAGIASQGPSSQRFWLGNAAGLGGFYVSWTFTAEDTLATARQFCGLSQLVGGTTDIDPAGLFPGIGVGCRNGATSLQFFCGGTIGGGVVSLGANFPIVNGGSWATVYKAEFYAASNSTSISWAVTNLATGAVAKGTVTAGTTTPSNTVFMAPTAVRSNNGVAAAATISIIDGYAEGFGP